LRPAGKKVFPPPKKKKIISLGIKNDTSKPLAKQEQGLGKELRTKNTDTVKYMVFILIINVLGIK